MLKAGPQMKSIFLEANICLKTLQSEILTAEQDTRPVHTLGSNMCFL